MAIIPAKHKIHPIIVMVVYMLLLQQWYLADGSFDSSSAMWHLTLSFRTLIHISLAVSETDFVGFKLGSFVSTSTGAIISVLELAGKTASYSMSLTCSWIDCSFDSFTLKSATFYC